MRFGVEYKKLDYVRDKRGVFMKNFRFKYNTTVWILLCVVLALSIAGLIWNVFNLTEYVWAGAFKITIYALIIAITAFLTVFVISVMLFGRYQIKDGYLYTRFGFVSSKEKIEDVVQITHFKKSDKLVLYFKDEKYTVIVIAKEEYEKFYGILTNAPRIELKEFEKDAKFFESCLPVEVLASRGVDTLRFGPMKPVGLVDKRTGVENYAVVQLRQDNSAKTLYNIVGFQTNLKWGSQKELINAIPGLEDANIVRYGVMHRNTFINSPKVLNRTLNARERNDLFFAGQLTGTEGYTESIATGMYAGINAAKMFLGEDLITLPEETILGALTKYISDEAHDKFQPINSNWGILPPVELPKKERKNKKMKAELMAKRAIEALLVVN